MGRIVRYAVATTLRQEEICKPEWPLVDMKKRLVVIQDRKDPTEPLTKSLTITESYSTRWPARQPISQKSASSRVASLKIAISSASRAGVA
jgi:hypothetical protein